MKHILLVDDHKMFADGLISILEKQGNFDIIHAKNAAEALDCVNRKVIDLAIVDIQMPDSSMNGIELTKQLLTDFHDLKILVVSMDKSAQTIDALITAGAHGYLVKDSGYETLLTAIKTLELGEEFWDPQMLKLLVEARRANTYGKPERSAQMDVVVLTKREKEVLTLLAEGLTSKEMAGELSVETSTIDTHRKNLIAKFGAKNSTDVVMKAKEQGLL